MDREKWDLSPCRGSMLRSSPGWMIPRQFGFRRCMPSWLLHSDSRACEIEERRERKNLRAMTGAAICQYSLMPIHGRVHEAAPSRNLAAIMRPCISYHDVMAFCNSEGSKESGARANCRLKTPGLMSSFRQDQTIAAMTALLNGVVVGRLPEISILLFR